MMQIPVAQAVTELNKLLREVAKGQGVRSNLLYYSDMLILFAKLLEPR